MNRERIFLHGTEPIDYRSVKKLIEDDFDNPSIGEYDYEDTPKCGCEKCEREKCECKSESDKLELPTLDELFDLDIDEDCVGEELIVVMEDGRVGVYMFDRYSDYKTSFFDSFEEFAKHVYTGKDAVQYCRDSYFDRPEITEIIMMEFPGVEEVLIGEL